MMRRILIVEDDAGLSRGIALALQGAGVQAAACGTLAEAREALAESTPDLLVLDINLPDGSGLDFCREVRARFAAPILFLTANDTELDVVAGLETGGDDYVTKPFSLAVLRARVNALLRRGGGRAAHSVATGPFFFDFEAMRFEKDGDPLELSKTEQKLLHLLVHNRGVTLSRDTLLSRIWPDGSEYVEENALSVAVRRLRAKLEDDPAAPRHIKTVYGVGYTWAVPA